MTNRALDQLMILAISRAAQLAYVEEAAGAFSHLSAADRFFRYHASKDRTATLGEELERLGDLAAFDSSFSFRVSDIGDSGSLFIRRLSLIGAAEKLASMPGEPSPVLVEAAEGEEGTACLVSRGGRKLKVPRT
jgi:hypothetical protein